MANRRRNSDILRVRGWRPHELVLDGKTVDVRIASAVGAGVRVNRQMSEASTLTIPIIDRGRELVANTELFGDSKLKVGIKVTTPDGRSWELMEMPDTDQGYDLIFFPAPIAKPMRHKSKPRKWTRSADFTRYDAVGAIAAASGVTVVTSPGGDAPQLVEGLTDDDITALETASYRRVAAQRETSSRISKANLTVKGVAMDAHQRQNTAVLLRVRQQVGAVGRAAVAAFCAAIGESAIRVVANQAGSAYGGVLQGRYRANALGPALFDINDTEGMAYYFWRGGKGYQVNGAIAAAREHPDWSPGEIALNVGGPQSNFATYEEGVRFYQQHAGEARAILSAFNVALDNDGFSSRVDAAGERSYLDEFEFYKEADAFDWDAMRDLADDVEWSLFDWGDQVMFTNDILLAQAPAVLTLSEDLPGVESIRGTWSQRKVIDELTVVLRAGDWALWTGACVIIEKKPGANGRWIVREIDQYPRADVQTATLRLSRAQAPKPEPTADVITATPDDEFGDQASTVAPGSGPAGEGVQGVYAAAKDIDRRNLPYGAGGHGLGWAAANSSSTLDCSSSTSIALHGGGLMPKAITGPQISDYFLTWGEAGEGDYMTVWVKPGSGPNGHVWIQFKGFDAKRFDTSAYGSGGSGPHLRYTDRPTAGFVPRHWPGT